MTFVTQRDNVNSSGKLCCYQLSLMCAFCDQSIYNSCSELVGWIKYQQPVFGNSLFLVTLY